MTEESTNIINPETTQAQFQPDQPIAAQSNSNAPQAPAQAKISSKRCRWLVILCILFTLVAWLTMMYSEHISLGASIAGTVASIFAIAYNGRGIWRDVAITCLIACGVLLLVFAIFHIFLSFILKVAG